MQHNGVLYANAWHLDWLHGRMPKSLGGQAGIAAARSVGAVRGDLAKTISALHVIGAASYVNDCMCGCGCCRCGVHGVATICSATCVTVERLAQQRRSNVLLCSPVPVCLCACAPVRLCASVPVYLYLCVCLW